MKTRIVLLAGTLGVLCAHGHQRVPASAALAEIKDDPALPRVLANVHFTPEGCEALAGQVAAAIEAALRK